MIKVLAHPERSPLFAGVLGLDLEQLDQTARQVANNHQRCAA